ncbi:MalY/PatB family protein [Aliarcobacter butzleri]|uniref:cysteine-S-conjugate beta-lyase n=1 Tax=Aliarcobacter butzleri TaxID=28197 RepID=A0AAW7Q2R6_9BACT|nr:MalY/PatB family protein [Aliarcobacter butzleri]MCR8710323.1 pyridoxal phosphate-dependent aminotransferase [Aliarcobacter butzleri]MDN5113813.1 pyridoxal phosphate-dependent aminotransferase [Aliarcobacter butzleri]
MKYNFNEIINRNNTNSSKWDTTQKDVIPMWVADMDFKVATPILDSILNRAQHGIFGYTMIPEEFYDAEILWWDKRHNFKIEKEWIEPTVGVIPSLSAVVQAFCEQGDKVLIQSPVYNYFNSSIKNNKCEIVTNDLIYNNGKYTIDFEDFEEKVKDKRVKLFILCNPHNPVGRVWTKEELTIMGNLCIKYHVIILSDEIHRDLVYSNFKYTPIASISKEILEQSITCTAPSKTFNLAGLKTSNIIVANKEYRKIINRSLNINESIEPNVFGIEALISAYTLSDSWLDELLIYLENNRDFVIEFVNKYIPQLKIIKPEATYLLWIDCSKLNIDSQTLVDKIYELGKVRLSSGITYGKNADKFIRINIACPKELLEDGLQRIQKTINLLKS